MLIAIVCWVVIVLTLMWLPIGGGGAGPLQHLDLVIHAGLFTGLGLLARENAARTINGDTIQYWIAGVVAVMLLGEGGQFLIPERNVSPLDFAANGFGILYGLWLWRSNRTLENRLRAGIIVVGGLLLMGGLILIPPNRVLQLIFEGPGAVIVQWIWISSIALLVIPQVFGRTHLDRVIPLILEGALAVAWWKGMPMLQAAIAGVLSGVSWIVWPFRRHSRGRELLVFGIGPLWGVWLITYLLPPGLWMVGCGGYLIGCFLFIPILLDGLWNLQEGEHTNGAISSGHA